MIEVLDMPQGSPEWYEARRGIPTASEFGAILAKGQGKMRRAYLMRLAAERLTGEVQEQYTSRHMQRGKDQEAEARDYYAFLTDVEPQMVPPGGPPPPTPLAGATDGLGAGMGGLAVHPSLRAHNVTGREPRHTSKTR
jgi:hypothetical protein